MTITTDGILAVCTGFLTICAVLAVIVKYVLLPYLEKHLIGPIGEVREQVKNSHETNLREDIDALRIAVAQGDRRNEQRWKQSEKQSQKQWSEHRAYSETVATRLSRVEARVEALRPSPDDN